MDTAAQGNDDLERRLRAGDDGALADLFALHWQRLWRMIDFRLDQSLQGRVDPDDILQESYLAAAKRIASFRERPTLSAFIWLRLIVKQTMIDVHRHHLGAQQRAAGREAPFPDGPWPQSTSSSLASCIVGHLTTPSQAAMRAETLSQLMQAIAQMDMLDQEILALRHFEELTNSEAAEVLGIQQKAASIRYIRALGRLKKILAGVPGLFEENRHA